MLSVWCCKYFCDVELSPCQSTASIVSLNSVILSFLVNEKSDFIKDDSSATVAAICSQQFKY